MENKRVTENKRLRALHNKSIDTDTTLGSGKVTAILGKGGFATVYEIWNPQLEIKRAVKLWHPNLSEKALERFETEIKITAKLHHPNIVEIHNVGEWNGIPYIEMEIINGYCLKEIISETGALPVDVASAICILICRALTYAHQQSYMLYNVQRKGIVHCDIKPANIMITRQGVVKLTDFGLATPTDETLHLEEDKVNGSVHYSSPEQLQMKHIDERTDIYSLGVVMYELFSGEKAFSGKDLEELIRRRLDDVYVPFHEVCRDISPAIKKIVKKSMAFDRDERYSSAQELLVDIEKAFYKMTKESPEYVISHFFSNPRRKKTTKSTSLKKTLIILSVLCAIGALICIFTTGKSDNSDQLNDTSSESISKAIKNKKEPTFKRGGSYYDKNSSDYLNKDSVNKFLPRHTKKNEYNKPVKEVKKQKAAPGPVSTNKTVEKKTSSAASVSADTILQRLNSAIQRKDYSKATELFKSNSIDDGEYYLLYSIFLCSKGKWESALSYAEKGFKTPTRRLSSEQRNLQYMSCKARCLTSAFDQSGLKEQGEKAMEAWFDVKYILKSMPSSAQFEYADSEIRRINKVLQNDLSN